MINVLRTTNIFFTNFESPLAGFLESVQMYRAHYCNSKSLICFMKWGIFVLLNKYFPPMTNIQS